MGWKFDKQWFDSRCGEQDFVFAETSRPVVGPTHPPLQWVMVTSRGQAVEARS